MLSVKKPWIAFIDGAVEETAVLALPILRVKQIRAIATAESSIAMVDCDNGICFFGFHK